MCEVRRGEEVLTVGHLHVGVGRGGEDRESDGSSREMHGVLSLGNK